MNMEVITLVEISPQHAQGICRRGNFSLILELFGQIFDFVKMNKVTIVGMPIFLLMRNRKRVLRKQIRQILLMWKWPYRLRGRFGQEKTSCRISSPMERWLNHSQGPHEACELTYQGLLAWIEAGGPQVKGPIREIYHNDPREMKREENITEILAPVG